MAGWKNVVINTNETTVVDLDFPDIIYPPTEY